MILLGNKCDLQRQRVVNNEMVEELKMQLNIPYMETSAKTRANVEEAFYELVRLIRRAQQQEKLQNNEISKKKRKFGCNLL